MIPELAEKIKNLATLLESAYQDLDMAAYDYQQDNHKDYKNLLNELIIYSNGFMEFCKGELNDLR